jgi:CRP-like cAMP-binding protein
MTGSIMHAARNSFITKLESVVPLSPEDKTSLDAICQIARKLPARADIIHKGERPCDVHIILAGWAARFEVLPDGGRQITAFLLPGDLCDQHVSVLGCMDHSICTLTDATVAHLPNGMLEQVAARRPNVARALWWSTLVDEAILRQWIVSLGRRDAYGAVSHLLCELQARLRIIGLVGDHHVGMPLTQHEIADALGLTPVHVNRVLRRLRDEGLVSLQKRVLSIPDVPKLREAAGFDGTYLHQLLLSRD